MRFIKTRMNTRKMKQEAMIEILSILNKFPVVERIEIAERIGKRLRQANSIESAKEVGEFRAKGVKIRKDAQE